VSFLTQLYVSARSRFHSQLDEDELKEKRRQKLLKAGYEARLRARKEKEAARKEKEEEERRELEERTADPTGWASKLREDHEVAWILYTLRASTDVLW
jgi:hypothetical protein